MLTLDGIIINLFDIFNIMCFRYDGRLIFKDLNSNSLLNGVQTSALNHLWTPQLAFVNALGPYQTVVDDISVCTIVLEENPTFNDLTNSLECKYKDCRRTIWIKRVSDYGFDANTNAINLEREYYQVFSCEFNLYYYPFDTQVLFSVIGKISDFFYYQVCHMVFALQGFTKEFIALNIDHVGVKYTGHIVIDNCNKINISLLRKKKSPGVWDTRLENILW